MDHLTNLFFRSGTSSTTNDAQFQSKLSQLNCSRSGSGGPRANRVRHSRVAEVATLARILFEGNCPRP